MSYSTIPQFGPFRTPSTIKQLIIWTCIIALASAGIQSIFDQFNIFPGPQNLLSLSWWGLRNFFLWQPITYLFVQSSSSYGITFFFLISLFFNMYLLWILGTAIYELVGKWAFLRFYFFCGIAAGLVSLMIMPVTGQYSILAGATPALLAVMTAWSMAFPESEIMLFFLIPVKAKLIVAGLLGAIILVSLSHWDLPSLALYVCAILIGYAYAVIAWGWQSPFAITQRLDSTLSTIALRLRRYTTLPHWLQRKKTLNNKPSAPAKSKVVDITTGKKLSDDDIFVDEMLAKISKNGERALSWSERHRMKQISERKMKEKNVNK